MGAAISSQNVETAFAIQNPRDEGITFAYPPVVEGAKGGDIMEQLCSELLSNEGVPHMQTDDDRWPLWGTPSHVTLNQGRFHSLKTFGDILIPAAPHNILISVKSVKAKERFLVSGNRLESVGFGFFSDAREFGTVSRMKLFKRWGFTAIYMPTRTLNTLLDSLEAHNRMNFAINVNGKPLYRSLETFTADMRRIAGKVSLDL